MLIFWRYWLRMCSAGTLRHPLWWLRKSHQDALLLKRWSFWIELGFWLSGIALETSFHVHLAASSYVQAAVAV